MTLLTVRSEVADFLSALVTVYTILIIAYILSQLFLGFGGRLPSYNRALIAVLDFLNQTVAPYLNVFRRYIPPLGPIDISPIIALILLRFVSAIVIGAVDDGQG